MDIATLIGIIMAMGLIVMSIMSGGPIVLFINVPSLMIVAGGTLGAALISYPLKDMLGCVGVVKNAFLQKIMDPKAVIGQFVEYAYKARRDGILALEEDMKSVEDEFLAKGIQLAIDGQEISAIENIMNTEIDWLKDRHKLGSDLFQTLGTLSPAMGLIGTLIGLVQMLQSLDDPSSIGPAMAVALLTTFYGALFANVIFNPLSGKLKKRSGEETLMRELVMEGVLAISAGENPRILEQKLQAFLAPKLRESAVDQKGE